MPRPTFFFHKWDFFVGKLLITSEENLLLPAQSPFPFLFFFLSVLTFFVFFYSFQFRFLQPYCNFSSLFLLLAYFIDLLFCNCFVLIFHFSNRLTIIQAFSYLCSQRSSSSSIRFLGLFRLHLLLSRPILVIPYKCLLSTIYRKISQTIKQSVSE